MAPTRELARSAAAAARSRATGHRGRRRVVVACGAGLVLALLTYVVLAQVRLPLTATLIVVGLLLCLVPSGDSLSRRIAVNGLVALGLLPVLWMPSALRDVNHGALALALTAGLLLTYVASRPSQAGRRLLPQLEAADAMLLPGLLAATVWGWHLVTVRTPAAALQALLPGYDHAGHYDIFAMTWSRGTFIDPRGASPDGSAWTYGHYPAGLHADAASLAQLTAGLRPRSTQALVTYAHVDAALVVLGTVVVTACLISTLRHPRVLPLLAPVTVLLTVLLWLPGGQVLWHGFENFWLAGVFSACCLLLAARALVLGEESFGGLLAVLAASVGTALNWLPLGIVSWIGPVVVFWVWWRGLPGSWRPRLAGALAAAVALLLVLRTASDLRSSVQVSTLVSASGGIQASAAGPIALVLLLATAITILLGRRAGRLADPALRRVRWLGVAVLAGWGLTGVVAAARHGSDADYYVTKLTLGMLLVTGCWLAFLMAVLLDRLLPVPAPDRRTAIGRAVAVVALCLVCTQMFGHMGLARARFEATRGVSHDQAGRPLDYRAMAEGILSATAAVDHERAFRTEYVAIGDGRWYIAVLPNTWFHSLTASLTSGTSRQSDGLQVSLWSDADAVQPVRGALRDDPARTVLVAPERLEGLRGLLDPDQAPRLRTWSARR